MEHPWHKYKLPPSYNRKCLGSGGYCEKNIKNKKRLSGLDAGQKLIFLIFALFSPIHETQFLGKRDIDTDSVCVRDGRLD